MYYQIETGDRVAFVNIKYLKLPTKTKYNIPLCLYGLNVDNKPVDRDTLGVYFHKASGKFKAQCKVNGKRQHLGYFNTNEEAFAAYKPFKEALCKQLALKWQTEIDERLFNAMMNWSVKSVLPN